MIISKAWKRSSILFGLLLILYLFGFSKVEAVSFKFVWQNTTVHIPLGASIEDFKDVPYARLYKNGTVLSDANITYNTEGDWLYYFKDINPYKIGTYPVWYKAYDSKYMPGTCTGYKALVNFVIEDITSPEVVIVNSTYNIPRGSEYNLENNYYAFDNYELKEVLVDNPINKDVAGDYKVTITAVDSSNNQRSKSFIAHVYETTYPEINYEISGNVLDVPLNEEYDIKALFTATDKVDGDITGDIVFEPFMNDKIMEYDYHISVTNKANLTTTKTIHIRVVDNETPKIILETHQVMLDYKTPISSLDFKAYVKDITDNQEIKYDRLEISHDLVNEIGTYTVTYTYSDGVNEAKEELEVILLSYDKPIIYCDDIYINSGDTINILDYASIEDASDPNILNSVEFLDSGVSYDKPGTYYADIYCMNSSGQSTTQKVKIVIDENRLFSSNNIGMSIILIVLIVIILLMGGFFLYYFVIRKIRNKKLV